MGFFRSGDSFTFEINHNKDILITIENGLAKLGFSNEQLLIKFTIMNMLHFPMDKEVVLFIMPYISSLINGYIENTFIENCYASCNIAVHKKLDERK